MTTANMTTIARPYAVAAFEFALKKNKLAEWQTMLNAAAYLPENLAVKNLLTNPKMTTKKLTSLFCDVLAAVLDEEKKNFIHLLAENHRLDTLPEIATLFNHYREEHDKTVTVNVTSAILLDDNYKARLITALTKRLKREVTLQCKVDESLIGGAIISAGDLVIDGTIRGKLNRLNEFISGTL